MKRFTHPDGLRALPQSKAGAYAANGPFPHIVIDDFTDADAPRALVSEFPEDNGKWRDHTHADTKMKTILTREDGFGQHTRNLFAEFSSSLFIDFLERITGISGLIPDPLTCPENRSRRSVALYYYTNGRSREEKTPMRTTVFKARPGESTSIRSLFERAVERGTPPFIFDVARRIRRARKTV